MPNRYSSFFFAVVFLPILLSACAVQGPPSGGPVDETPPFVTATFPAADSTTIARDTEISVTFSESMNRASVQAALFISPLPESDVDLSWDNEILKIKINELLDQDQTYVIRIGSSAQDMRRNPLEQTFSFAFSTGDDIDKGEIRGRVMDYSNGASVKGVGNSVIWGFRLDGDSEPNPVKSKGEFITQADNEGDFRLTHLKDGTYRLYAITNDDNDFEFSPVRDRIGLPSGDIVISDDVKAAPMFFNPVQIDTFALQLRFLEVTDRNHLRLNFNNPLNLHSVDSRNFRIFQLPGREELSDGIKTYYYSPFSDNVLSLYSDNLVPGVQYQLSVDGIDDVYGNRLAGLLDSTTLFTASTLQDTLPFSMTFLDPADSTFNVPVHTPIMMSFNQPLDSSVLASHFFVHDSLDRPVPGSITSKSTSEYHFLPNNNYQPGMKYEISLEPDSILSVEGKQLNLEKSSFSFGTIEEQNTGAVLGTIDVIGDPERYAIIVRLHREGRSGDLPVISRDRSGGTFEFRGILPGEYILDAFLDKDGSGTWSPGAIRPFKPAESFAVYSRLVTVRPGIENTGINLVLYVR